MTDSSRGYQQFFAELKRRRVFRVMAVYGIVAFIVLQVADLVFPILELPDWTLQLVLMLSLLGFPIAIVLAWAFDSTPEGVVRTGDAAPGELDAIISAPAPQRLPAGLMALAGVAALVAGTWWIARSTAPEAAVTATQANLISGLQLVDLADDDRPSIAVLPFADMSPDGDQEYFSDGMTEEILNVLAKIRALRVTARTSTFALKDRELTAVQWGDTLRVGYLVEGSVRKAGDEVRITAQLIDTSDGSHLWSESYDRALENVFQIQSEIAGAIAEALTVPLGLDDSSDLVTPTGDLEAYDLYLAGRAQLRRRGESLLEAIRLFEAAIARDSTWAPVWAALAEAKETRAFYTETYDLEDDIPDSLEAAALLAGSEVAATRALELDPRNSSAMVALGSVYRDRGQLADAEEFFHRALEVEPDNAAAHQEYAELLAHWGRIAEAVEFADRAAMLDPAPVRLYVAALTLDLDDRISEATDVLRFAMRQDPDVDYIWSWLYGAVNLALLGEADEAIQAYERLWRNPPDDARGWLNARDFAAWASGAAEGRLDDLPEGWTFFLRDMVLTEQSDMDVTWLVNNNWKSSHGLVASGWVWSPALDTLRSDPRIQAHMRSVGLSDARLQRTPVEERTRPMILGSAP